MGVYPDGDLGNSQISLIPLNFHDMLSERERDPNHSLCPVGKAVSRTFLKALRPWPKADAENQPSELGCERCAMLAGGASRGRRNEVHNSNHLLRSEAHLTPE